MKRVNDFRGGKANAKRFHSADEAPLQYGVRRGEEVKEAIFTHEDYILFVYVVGVKAAGQPAMLQ